MKILVLLVLIFLLIKTIINSKKLSRVKPISFILLPILVLLYFHETFKRSYIPDVSYIIVIISMFIGIIIGSMRGKSYSFTLNADGDFFYIKEIVDSTILLALIILEFIFNLLFRSLTIKVIIVIITALISLVVASIVARRVVMFLKYQKMRKNL
ncbi:MAG: hypothetical protein ACRC57_06560 [Sarcina sp.]